jgi:glutamate formiminotransferase/formiminotetrahydrofolate cyclodeaminase
LEAARILATERGLVVTGSEIVGMIPFKALYETGKYYLNKQGKSTGIPITDIIETAVQSLGLRDVSDFVIEERVLGLPKYDKSALVFKTIINFMDEVSRESPAPGGGSIAALAGSLGASLISMVSNLTTFKFGTENIDEILTKVAEKAQTIKNLLLVAVDDDTNAFNSFMDAKRLPQQTDAEKHVREIAMQQGLKEAVLVPLNTAELSLEILKLSGVVAKFGNINSITDVGVGSQIAKTGVIGGIYNVLINLKDIKDQDFKAKMRAKCEILKSESEKLTTEIDELVLSKMK